MPVTLPKNAMFRWEARSFWQANRSKNSISAKRSWQVEYLINAWAIRNPLLY